MHLLENDIAIHFRFKFEEIFKGGSLISQALKGNIEEDRVKGNKVKYVNFNINSVLQHSTEWKWPV